MYALYLAISGRMIWHAPDVPCVEHLNHLLEGVSDELGSIIMEACLDPGHGVPVPDPEELGGNFL